MAIAIQKFENHHLVCVGFNLFVNLPDQVFVNAFWRKKLDLIAGRWRLSYSEFGEVGMVAETQGTPGDVKDNLQEGSN